MDSEEVSAIISDVRSAVVGITFYYENEVLAGGSGFVYKGYLISNNHVFNPKYSQFKPETEVRLRFGDTPQYANDDVVIRYGSFTPYAGSDQYSYDYIVYKLPIDTSNRYQFVLKPDNSYEGQSVLLCGYPFNTKYMTSHVGRISAIFTENNVKTLQLDASVNNGNSGGPLIDIKTKELIGVVTKKRTGLFSEFDDLIKSYDNNIKVMSSVKANMSIGGIDPVKVLIATQEQMKVVSENIKRSSNTGIGFAHSCDKILAENL
ncbi:MAG: hypothetical protein JWN28_704 [Candidatus Saccharibacteria bacterium]|nr:hypothetical protein [Candidatus Saccharibacteria bacterium]